jgi:hypothetical protein
MRACCLKVIAVPLFAGALVGMACQTATGPTASGALGPSPSQLAQAAGLSPQDLVAHGWDCRPTPIPNRVSCSPPNQTHPLSLPGPPSPGEGQPTFTLLVFDNGVFTGSDLLIRSDLYRNQECHATGAPYRFISRIGYYECLHPAGV